MTEYLNTKEAAEYLGCSVITLKRLAADGLIKPDIHQTRMNLYTRATLDAYRPQLKQRGRPVKA